MTENQRIAQTILEQLGGARFLVMTGAKNLVAIERGLRMKLPANITKDRRNYFEIVLNGKDLYDLEAFRVVPSKPDRHKIMTGKDVSADMLQAFFTQITGLDTRI